MRKQNREENRFWTFTDIAVAMLCIVITTWTLLYAIGQMITG